MLGRLVLLPPTQHGLEVAREFAPFELLVDHAAHGGFSTYYASSRRCVVARPKGFLEIRRGLASIDQFAGSGGLCVLFRVCLRA